MEVQALIQIMRELAPGFEPESSIMNDFLGNEPEEITKLGVCIDPTEQNIYTAASKGIKVLISYHPWMGEALPIIQSKRMIILPLHTNWDNAPEGVNFTLGRAIGLQELTVVDSVVMGQGEMTFRELLERCQRILERNVIPYYGELRYAVRKVGIWSGPGFLPHNQKLWKICREEGCDTIISGEMSLLPIRFAAARQLKLVDLGHSGITKPSMVHLIDLLELRLKALNCLVEFFEDYYCCNYYTKSYFLQQSEMDESLPLFQFFEKVD